VKVESSRDILTEPVAVLGLPEDGDLFLLRLTSLRFAKYEVAFFKCEVATSYFVFGIAFSCCDFLLVFPLKFAFLDQALLRFHTVKNLKNERTKLQCAFSVICFD